MEKVNTINAGKNGLTQNLISEINSRLEEYGTVKVKMLRSFRNEDKKKLADEITSNVNGKLVDMRGFVLTLKRC